MPDRTEGRTILLIDPDAGSRARVARLLTESGHRVVALPDSDSPSRIERPDAVVATLDWNPESGARRVRALKRQAGGAPLLLLCDARRLDAAVRALGHGAEDYLLRPPDRLELRARLARVLEKGDLDTRIAYYQDELARRSAHTEPEARSTAMRSLLDRVHRVAPMRVTALIIGESGVGKELVARSIHLESPRRERPFIALNCAAIPASLIESELFGHEKGSFTGAHARSRGKFEIADGGTMFLDEIGEMALDTQAKLLRVLEEREFMRVGGDHSIRVDVRVIAATNANLERLVSEGLFRRDLYYRLKVVTLRVPALRERREDIPALVHTFLDELARANAVARKTIAPGALVVLQDYAWPGNVRELKNFVESALVSVPGDRIGEEHLPRSMRKQRAPAEPSRLVAGTRLDEMERELIRLTLEHTGGNRTHAAALLGIGVRTLQRKMRGYGITMPSTRRRSRRAR